MSNVAKRIVATGLVPVKASVRLAQEARHYKEIVELESVVERQGDDMVLIRDFRFFTNGRTFSEPISTATPFRLASSAQPQFLRRVTELEAMTSSPLKRVSLASLTPDDFNKFAPRDDCGYLVQSDDKFFRVAPLRELVSIFERSVGVDFKRESYERGQGSALKRFYAGLSEFHDYSDQAEALPLKL